MADEFSNNFKMHLNETALDSLTQDLGALMGGGSFHEGKAVGFPVGIDLGVHVPILDVQTDNHILKDDGSTSQVLWGQVEIGLPKKINLVGRRGELFEADLLGGGLRFGFIEPTTSVIPSLSFMALYSQLKHEFFESETLSFNVVASFGFPFVHPYLGAGYDRAKLTPTAMAFQGVAPAVRRDVKGKSEGYRVEAGVNISVFPFSYVNAAAGLANEEKMLHFGLGIKI